MPHIIKPPPPRQPQGPLRQYLEFRPPRPWPSSGVPPEIRDIDTFQQVHRFFDDRLKIYLERGWSRYQTLDPSIWEELLQAYKHLLFACNAEARIDFAQTNSDVIREFGIADLDPHFFVSFAPADCVVPLEEAHRFDVRIIQQTLRQSMPAIPFIGMVEAGLYKRWGPRGPSPGRDHVSWHAHLITWGVARFQLVKALAPLRARSANIYDRPALFIRKLPADQLERVLLYTLKGQTKHYRVNQTPGENSDPDTGEVWHCTRQSKDWMRTGDRVRMCRAMKGRRLTDLQFGNASGKWIARAVRFKLMQHFCEWADGENRRLKPDGRDLPYPQVVANRKLGQRLQRQQPEIRAGFPFARLEDIVSAG